MVEKQDAYQEDPDWSAEGNNKAAPSPSLTADSRLGAEKEPEQDIEMSDIETHGGSTQGDSSVLTSCARDEFTSSLTSSVSRPIVDDPACSEPLSSSGVEQDPGVPRDRAQGKPSLVASGLEADAGVAPGAGRGDGKERTPPAEQRTRSRPQSLNLGTPGELVYEKEGEGSRWDDDSSEGGSDREDTQEQKMESGKRPVKDDKKVLGTNQLVGILGDSKQASTILSGDGQSDVSAQGTGIYKSQAGQEPRNTDLASVNGPGMAGYDSVALEVKDITVRNPSSRGRGLIDSKELAEVKLRQVRTHERKMSSTGGEDIEGLIGDKVQRRSFHRLSGSHQSEITRIVPLKPERSKSVAGKDESDRAGQVESLRVARTEYRWSVGAPEGSSDLHWAEASAFQSAFCEDLEGADKSEMHSGRFDESCHAARAEPAGGHLFNIKGSAFAKMAPPAPPVKTQKAKESGLILRNSRNASREPCLDAAKKRLSVTLVTPASTVQSLEMRAWHELPTDAHTPIFPPLLLYFFYICFQ